MNTINDLINLSTLTNESDRNKFDKVYNEILFPIMKDRANRLKKRELSITNNMHQNSIREKLQNIGIDANLQHLVETSMKPYLEEKGFVIATKSPNYSVDIRW